MRRSGLLQATEPVLLCCAPLACPGIPLVRRAGVGELSDWEDSIMWDELSARVENGLGLSKLTQIAFLNATDGTQAWVSRNLDTRQVRGGRAGS